MTSPTRPDSTRTASREAVVALVIKALRDAETLRLDGELVVTVTVQAGQPRHTQPHLRGRKKRVG